MFCGQCGAELRDGAAFCPKCGAGQDVAPEREEVRQTQAAEPTAVQDTEMCPPGKKGIPMAGIIALAAAGLAAVIAVVVLAFFPGAESKNDKKTKEAGNAAGETAGEIPLYNISDVAVVDLAAENHDLGVKQPGMAWDSSLFYWLEDVDTASPDDGYIANCRVTKTLLRDAGTKKLRQYEIYSNPDSGDIYKIVSIEEWEEGVDLVDYYYRDGRPDFIFKRDDTVYTPTYATPAKTGERYYFNADVMVRWRIIREPGVIGEYVLAPGQVNYSQADYYAESDEVRSAYDETEKRMFLEACNTYDAIAAGGNIGLVQGVLRDTMGNGIEGKKVKVYRESDDVLLYEAVTDADGAYSFFVYLDGTPCYLRVDGDELYRETLVQGMQLMQSSVKYSYGLTMHKNSGDEYLVKLYAYSCMDVVSDEEGTVRGTPIQNVTATVREGAGNYSGESICTVETQNGELTANLPSGAYTVQFHADGYLDSYMEVEVEEDAVTRDAYVMAGLAENQTGIVLTWDSDAVDLDLTLFTPYQAANGDMAHIGGGINQDGYGNILVSDNKSGCEAMFINSGEQGSYKLYVNNYTDSMAGNYSSDALYRINVHVYVYNSDGFVAEYTIPLGQNGVVWEVAEINGRTVTPAQRVYADVSGKSWWTGNKEVWSAEEDAALLADLESGDSSLRELMEALVHKLSDENIHSLLRGEKEGIERFFTADCPAAAALRYTRENQPPNSAELERQTDAQSFLTEEQVQYLLYSVCGKQMDFDLSGIIDSRISSYIAFDYPAGDNSWEVLERFSVERINANTWKVRAYDVFHRDDLEPSRIVSRVCFTVVKNPDSCFDGYSLTGFEVEEEAPTDWARIYYEYLTQREWPIDWEVEPDNFDSLENFDVRMLYIDDDMIPELFITETRGGWESTILHISNGSIQEVCEPTPHDVYYIKPYTGVVMVIFGGHEWRNATYYNLQDSVCTEIGMRLWSEQVAAPETYYLCGQEGSREEVSKEAFAEAIKGYIGSEDWRFEDSVCLSYAGSRDTNDPYAWKNYTSYTDLLNFLEWQQKQRH
ncbi:MAG: zinc-ribbon domain-containing protein [Lachnoclostridium sp.]|nr:zinc-ribbon domain-containing protein [Lachnospira sp.]MCM1246938.1 zinc-ribbon domain-containing protein [Lachnoclostridium sp.]